ncbi:PadR family transcriptional regulator [Aurantiacibacter xanthus]|uniref:PadR family transcriptional regulator n=1 Tax=Aurantiacibacter xanthus TaxID=1784712 RepID=A0A3A1P656_9SPHN|nr:PadR family transcriptional regulator [Aurantiacibacter xanthus]RIV86392.1 PadR family transcriptional regulator [Aurantiacibacter xanthus]
MTNDNRNRDDDRDDEYGEGDDFAGRGGRPRRHGRGGDSFGIEGVLGPDGIFGPQGLFGPGGLLGQAGRRGGININLGGGKGEHRGRDHGGPRRRKMFAPGELRLVLLALIAEEPRHGYDCIRAMDEATDGAYTPSPGVIYPTLAMLADEGLIAAQPSEDARKVFEATEAGHAELAENAEEIEALLERLGKRGERARAAKSSDMMRALGNLASVLTNRAAAGRFNSENKEQIVDLIDELARKIEKL